MSHHHFRIQRPSSPPGILIRDRTHSEQVKVRTSVGEAHRLYPMSPKPQAGILPLQHTLYGKKQKVLADANPCMRQNAGQHVDENLKMRKSEGCLSIPKLMRLPLHTADLEQTPNPLLCTILKDCHKRLVLPSPAQELYRHGDGQRDSSHCTRQTGQSQVQKL